MSENPILFGIVDSKVQKQEVLDNVCFGRVKWVNPSPPAGQVTCHICRCIMSLVIQVTCPFPGRGSDLIRKLVVFVCLNHSKQAEGWKVIRQVKKPEKSPVPQLPDSSDWGEEDEWGDDEEVDWMANKVQDISMENEPVCEIPSTSSEPDVELGEIGAGLYINVMEDYSESAELEHENELLRKYQLQEQTEHPTGSGMDVDSCALPEEDDDEEDSMVEEFLNCLRKMPNQILRYHVMGSPVSLDSKQFSSGSLPPCCQSCGASRCFEFQLMPKLVDISKNRLEFGTIQIFTCSANCSENVNNLEHIVFQSEPDASDYK